MAGYIQPGDQRRPWTAEEHRAEARRLLGHPGTDGDTVNRLAAAQVHALLALSLRPLPGPS
ncbi:hypothetical protein AB0A74_24775 [Saccharothrix sp. NPDC042600]|uniref:hypothetical protein n=1 Tax=Saccharothrix TaxID=2071 RepID=UPI003404627F|nr:hypothetical protein GCM10017745_18010 [Saccharothrix mutabilis subsp. capreolus]